MLRSLRMRSAYYTKNPQNMVFATKNEASDFYSELNNHIFAEDDDFFVETKTAQEVEDYLESKKQNFLSELYLDYPLTRDIVEYIDMEKLSDRIAYSPQMFYTIFLTIYDKSDNDNLEEQVTTTQRNLLEKALMTAISRGADVEILNLKLAKILNEKYKDFAEAQTKDTKDVYQQDITHVEHLLACAEQLTQKSPYQKLFNKAEEISILQQKASKLEGDEWEKLDAKLTDMKMDLKKECSMFDAAMLKEVTEYHRQYIIEVDKNMAMVNNSKFNIQNTNQTSANRAINILNFYIKNIENQKEKN